MYGDHRDLHVLTHSFPTRRSSDLFGADSPFIPFSSKKPRIAPSCASDFAHTTNTSAIGELVLHILAPLRRYPPSIFSARVRIPPGSLPASVPVSPKQPTSSPEVSSGRNFRFCSSLP